MCVRISSTQRHRIHIFSYGSVSFCLLFIGVLFSTVAIVQKDSLIGKVWLAGPTTMVVGLVLLGKVIIDWSELKKSESYEPIDQQPDMEWNERHGSSIEKNDCNNPISVEMHERSGGCTPARAAKVTNKDYLQKCNCRELWTPVYREPHTIQTLYNGDHMHSGTYSKSNSDSIPLNTTYQGEILVLTDHYYLI